MTDDWGKMQAEVGISEVKRLVEDATVEDVETPTGRKDVEISWQDADGFHSEDGTAVGVYYEPDRRSPQVVHIDWGSQSRTTVKWENILSFEEGEYYTSDENDV